MTSLDLSYCEITDAGAVALAAGLGSSRTLESLNLVNNGKITEVGIRALASAMETCKSLRELDLQFCKIKDAGVGAIAGALAASSMTSLLPLFSHHLSPTGALG